MIDAGMSVSLDPQSVAIRQQPIIIYRACRGGGIAGESLIIID